MSGQRNSGNRRQNSGNPPSVCRKPQITRQLARSLYLAGDTFTAADISVGDSLIWVKRCKLFDFGKIELAYIERLIAPNAS